MNIQHLNIFCKVYENKSISKVASLEYISQPAVTKVIKKMEENYNTLLFNRERGRIIPTESGEKLYSLAKQITEMYKLSLDIIQHKKTQDTLLRIGASYTIGDYLLPEIINKFSVLYPTHKFNILISNTPKIISQLDNYEIDIALVESNFNGEGFKSKIFAQDDLIIVIPSDHHFDNGSEINLYDLKNEQMIWRELESGTRVVIENELKKCGILNEITSFLELGSIESIKKSVEVGLGISILPRISVVDELKYGTIKFVYCKDLLLTRNLFAVQKPTRFEREGVTNFLSFLQSNYF